MDDINFDIFDIFDIVFLQWGEKTVKMKFLEATLCVMLFEMRDKAVIFRWRSEQNSTS